MSRWLEWISVHGFGDCFVSETRFENHGQYRAAKL